MKNNMTRAISHNGGIVICALDSTSIVRRAEGIHRPSAVATAALGRLLTAAALMGSWLKADGDSITLRVNGGGPLGSMVAISDSYSHVRGYVQNPLADVPLRGDGKLDVGRAVGNQGSLSVIRDMGFGEPYIGHTPLVSGEIAEDISAYYAESEQTATCCALGVLVNPDLSVRCAGGFLMQLLPGATEQEIARLEENLTQMPPVSEFLAAGKTPREMTDILLNGFAPDILDESTAEYRCNCSQQRTEDKIYGLGEKEVESLLAEDAIANVECHFCGKHYKVDLHKILAELKNRA